MKKLVIITCIVSLSLIFSLTTFAQNLLSDGDFGDSGTPADITNSSFNPNSGTPNIDQWLGLNSGDSRWYVITNNDGYNFLNENTYARQNQNGKVRLFQAIESSSLPFGNYRISFYYKNTAAASTPHPWAWVLGVNIGDRTITQFPGGNGPTGDGFPSGGTPSEISDWAVLYQKKLAGTCPFASCDDGPGLPVDWTRVDDTFPLNTTYDFLVVVFSFGGPSSEFRALDDVVLERATIPVAVDIKPGSCPNPLNVKSKGVLPVAILGTDAFDVTQIDPETIQLEGISPLRWALSDVATPFTPFQGKQDCKLDCHESCTDGYTDLILNFNRQEIIAAIGEVNDGDCYVARLTGYLQEEAGGTEIVGEDVILIIKKGRN